jgi:hypothetical protein
MGHPQIQELAKAVPPALTPSFVFRGIGFSLWNLDLARFKTHRLKPMPQKTVQFLVLLE